MKKRVSLIICVMLLLSLTMQVFAFASVPLKGIKLSVSAISLIAGNTYNLKAALVPANTTQKGLNYSTSNKLIASVDSKGKITAKKAGKATITVTSTANKAIAAKCVVTVKFATIPTINYMLTWDPGLPIGSNSQVFEEWGRRTGVKFNVTIPPRDAYKEKANIVIAAGEIPDMMKFFQDDKTFKVYGPKLFAPLDEYIKNGSLPNMVKYFNKYPEFKEVMKSPVDGKTYAFGLVQDFDYFSNLWYVRNDMLKKKGLDASNIKTLDDLKTAMLALKEVKGSNYITSTRLGFSYYSFATGPYFGLGSLGLMLDNNRKGGTGKWVFAPVEFKNRFKQYVEFEKWMYDQKLLDPNFLTMKDQELFSGYNSGQYPLQREQFTMASAPASSMNPKNDLSIDIKPIYPIEINGEKFTQAASNHYNIGYRSPVVINNKSKKIDYIVKAMDYTYSDEGVEFFMLGVEGQTFSKDSKTPSGYKLDKVQSVWTLENGKYPEGMKRLQDYGFYTWWLTGVVPAYNRFNLLNYKEGENDRALAPLNEMQEMKKRGLLRSPDPVAPTFIGNDNLRNAELSNQLNTYTSENVSKFILGAKPMSDWDSFIKGYENLNYKELIDLYNKTQKW